MAKDIMVKANGTFKNSFDQILFRQGMAYKVVDETERSYVVQNELKTESMVRKNRMGTDFEYADSGNYTGAHKVGDIVKHRGGGFMHECKVTEVWNVDGKNGLTIKPIGYGFDVDIYEEQL